MAKQDIPRETIKKLRADSVVFYDTVGDIISYTSRVENVKDNSLGWVVGFGKVRVQVKWDGYKYGGHGKEFYSHTHPMNRGFHSEIPGNLRLMWTTETFPYGVTSDESTNRKEEILKVMHSVNQKEEEHRKLTGEVDVKYTDDGDYLISFGEQGSRWSVQIPIEPQLAGILLAKLAGQIAEWGV